MNFTKGPWEVSSVAFGGIDDGSNLFIRSHNGLVAQACTIHEGLVNAQANAALIASCPALYEACQTALNNLAPKYSGEHIVIKQLRAALTLAEGGE